jgi:hypothetical protein
MATHEPRLHLVDQVNKLAALVAAIVSYLSSLTLKLPMSFPPALTTATAPMPALCEASVELDRKMALTTWRVSACLVRTVWAINSTVHSCC